MAALLPLSTTAKMVAINVKRPGTRTTPMTSGTSAPTSLSLDIDSSVERIRTRASAVRKMSTACGHTLKLTPPGVDQQMPPADLSTITLYTTNSGTPRKHQETRKWDFANMVAAPAKNVETLGSLPTHGKDSLPWVDAT